MTFQTRGIVLLRVITLHESKTTLQLQGSSPRRGCITNCCPRIDASCTKFVLRPLPDQLVIAKQWVVT